jgi:hypothetical protein
MGRVKNKLVATPARMPSASLFGAPPLIAGEDFSLYEEFLARVFAAVKPRDVIEEMAVRDLVDLDWEILRLRRVKSGLFAAGLQGSLLAKLLPAPNVTEPEARALAQHFVAGDASATEEVEKILASIGLSLDAVTANTMTIRLREFDAIERLIASAEARRHAALRELERRRAALAAALPRDEEVVDADFEEVDPEERTEMALADDHVDYGRLRRPR